MKLDRLPVRLERRLNGPPRWAMIAMPLLSGLVALLIAGVVLLISGHDPIATYQSMFEAAFTSSGALSATLVSATPLLFTGLAAAIAFRMKAWNIGGEGQLYAGAICAAAAGIALGGQGLAIALPAMLVAATIGGAAWAAIPGLLRAYLGTNEILTSLMLNYVAGFLMYYLIFDSKSYWRDVTSPGAQVFPQGKQLDPAAHWPGFVGSGLVVPLGFVIGAVLAALLFVVLRHTRFGFRLRVIADSPAAGRYAGMNTKRMFVLVMLISGALAGLAGASQVGDFSHVLEPEGLQQAQFGYTGIVGAALAHYNPLGVVISAVFLGGITNAGFKLQGATFPHGLVGTIEGIILFCVLGGEVLVRYRVRLGSAAGRPSPDPAPGAEPAPLTTGNAASGRPA